MGPSLLTAMERTGKADGSGGRPTHVPVLLGELLDAVARYLGPEPVGLAVDCTLGAGGHASALLARYSGLELLGLDWDPDSLVHGRAALLPFGSRARAVRAHMASLETTLAAEFGAGVAPLLVYADLGVCSLHFDRPERGFSLQADGPLDMRMDPDQPLTAADVVNGWSEEQLADLFFHEGGERRARQVARALCEARRRAPFLRTLALASLVERELGPGGRLHSATRVFQALRIAVNGEMRELDTFLVQAERCLAPGGLLAVITFHGGEESAVKRHFEAAAARGTLEVLTKKPLQAGRSEVRANARSRSAHLRLARRAGGAGHVGGGGAR